MAVTMPDELLRCPRDACEVMHRDPLATVLMGVMLYFEETVGFWLTGGDSGDTLAICTKAPWVELPCVAAPTAGYPQGQVMYFDIVALALTTLPNAGANPLCAHVRVAAVQGATRVEVNFDGTLVA